MQKALLLILLLPILPLYIWAKADASAELTDYLATRGYHAIPYEELPSRHGVLEVNINGVTGWFVLDSGASGTVLHHDRVNKFGLTQTIDGDHEPATGVGGQVHTQPYAVGAFRIGEHDLELAQIISMDMSYVVDALSSQSDRVIDGVIGQDVMDQYQAIIDTANDTLYLKISLSPSAKLASKQV